MPSLAGYSGWTAPVTGLDELRRGTYLGYNVRRYDGSMLEWTALGFPLEP
jgi:3-mercaptopyruvate sulfurtransferase SseA